MRRWLTARALVGGALVVSLVAGACSSDGGGGAETPAACKRKAGEAAAKAVLRCTETSVAFVETEAATGTGVVVQVGTDDKRYVLTNEHVVDPFDAVDVTIDGRTTEHVPVVGIDSAADVALVGPLTGRGLPRPLAIADGTGLERGDDVFLVGFPGETASEELEATIAAGIVSRQRAVKEFDQSYIQTDASIGGGQSGGPLFDGAGRVIGISGLSYAEEFALALSGKDTKQAMRRILAGDGDEYLSVPSVARGGVGSTSGTLRLRDASDGQVLFLPAAPGDRTWHLTIDMASQPIVSVESMTGEEPLAISRNAADVQQALARDLARARGGRPEDLFDPSALGSTAKQQEREAAPGVFTLPVKADESAMVIVAAPLTGGPVEVPWQSDLPLVQASRPLEEVRLVLGKHVERTIGWVDTGVDVLVELEAGKEVQLFARSPVGDPGFAVFRPDQPLDSVTLADPEGAGVETFDDTDDGLFGVDAKTAYTAELAGIYRFRIYANDGVAVRVRFSVLDCAKVECHKTKAKGAKD